MSDRRLSIDADLSLEIAGEAATLTGHGQTLRLTIERSRTLQRFFEVTLPEAGVLGQTSLQPKDFPALLTSQGLTLEIADANGLLLQLGKAAEGRRYTLPVIGTVKDVALASMRAAARLAMNY